MKKYTGLSEKDYQWCLAVEKDWLRRLPGIIASSNERLEVWREEIEHAV